MEYTYDGIAYRQSIDPNAPWLVNFVARAEEIDKWSGIPRRSENGLIGFQRPDDQNRVLRTREFFNTPPNQSPTALIIGIHKVENDEFRRASIEFQDDESTANIRKCKLTIKIEETNLNAVVEELRQQLYLRLKDIKPQGGEEDGYEEDDNSDDDQEDEEGDDASDEIELGRSLLVDLSKKLNDENWCEQNKQDLIDLAKPCTIIDGQHRLKGAEACERGIPFSVIAIFDCSWPEQVFQFTVVNYLAKGIPDQFITQNAALSLTGAELEQLKSRLQQAKVKVVEYELMKVVNFDTRSPFYQLVSMASAGNEPGKIGYKTMVKIASEWHRGKEPAIKQIISHCYPDVAGKVNYQKRERLRRWIDEEWGEFFIDFWSEVKNSFCSRSKLGERVWGVGSNLMIATVLHQFQKTFFINLSNQDEEFFKVNPDENDLAVQQLRIKIRSRAQRFSECFSPDFFEANWKLTSLSTGPGKTHLLAAFRNFVDSKGSYQWGKNALITGKVD